MEWGSKGNIYVLIEKGGRKKIISLEIDIPNEDEDVTIEDLINVDRQLISSCCN